MSDVVRLLTPTQTEKFKALVEKTGSRDQMARISARLSLNKFVLEHGEDVCKATFDAMKKKRKARRKKQ